MKGTSHVIALLLVLSEPLSFGLSCARAPAATSPAISPTTPLLTTPVLTTPVPAPTSPMVLSLPDLQYRLISNFDDVFYCDPDFYPVGRPEQEKNNALEQFPVIRANTGEFLAIREHLGLPDRDDYTDEEKLLIYREHKKLTLAVQLFASGTAYDFTLRVGEGNGQRISGLITPSGDITVLKQEPSFNTCPICLAEGTLVDAPGGPVPVERLRAGMPVWTVDSLGNRVLGTVDRINSTPVPFQFHVVSVTLKDGRNVTASPGHPTAEGRSLGEYRTGDVLDGAEVVTVVQETYDADFTYDLLPSGETGMYWANGVLLRSTLMPAPRAAHTTAVP